MSSLDDVMDFQTCVVRLSNDVTIIMFDLHAAIRSCRVLFSISNAFMKVGSSQLSSFSAFTAKKKTSEMLINNLAIQPYAESRLNDKFGFRTSLYPRAQFFLAQVTISTIQRKKCN